MKTHSPSVIRTTQKTLLITAAVLASHQLQGQGTVDFSNVGLANSFVYDDRSGTSVRAQVGTTFSVALYWAPVNPLNPPTPPDPSLFTQQGPSANIGPSAGDYSGGVITITTISPPGGLAWFQVRAWETACGSTFEHAYEMSGSTGVSAIIDAQTGDPTSGGSPGRLAGIGPIHVGLAVGPPFSDPCVPEPSTVLLGLLGAIVVFGFSRHKRSG